MNTTARAGRVLRSLPEADAAAIIATLEHAIRYALAEPVAPGLWAVTAPVGGTSHRVTFGAPVGITTVVAMTPVRISGGAAA